MKGHGESQGWGSLFFIVLALCSLQDSYVCIMKSNIYFDNVVLDNELTENGIDLNELMALVKVLLTFCDDQGNGCKKAIPVMQYLHNEGVIYYDYDLATFYLEGKVIAEDGPLAIELLKEIASSPINDALSMRKLGDCYHYGRGTSPDATEAIKWYEKGAVYGDEYSALNAGVLYARGFREMKPNYKKAKPYLKMIKHDKKYKKIAREWLEAIKNGDTPDYSF